MAAGEIPKITWGTSFANTWELGYPMDAVTAWSDPREGFETSLSPSGSEDAWVPGLDYFLGGLARWIPFADGTAPDGTTLTGWDGAAGVDAALYWLRAKNEARFYPLRSSGSYKTVKLAAPMGGKPAQERDGTRQLNILLRATDALAFVGY